MYRARRGTVTSVACIYIAILNLAAAKDTEWNEWQSADGERSLRIVGRLFWDYADYGDGGPVLVAGDRITSARLGVAGKLTSTTDYLLQYEFREHFAGRDKTQLRYGVLTYKALNPLMFEVGQMNEPVGLEASTSQRANTFMERALPFTFVPFYHFGGAAYYVKKPLFLHIGAFGRTYLNTVSDAGTGVSSRIVYSVADNDTSALHVGGSYFVRRPDSMSLRFAARPESAVTDSRLVDTRDIDFVESYKGAGLEFAYVRGALSFQGEYLAAWPSRTGDRPDPFFWGSYLYASYFLTGESRRYDSSRAAFNSIRPHHKRFGAWETALRYSVLDLDSGEVEGGRERNTTLALNWYINPKVRLMFNYIWVDGKRRSLRTDTEIAQIRLQLNL